MDATEGATILFRVAQESLSLSTIKDTAARIANTIATKTASAATKAWAAVQWVLNAAMTANPIGLIIAGIVLLIGVIVLIATKTTWFQTIWTAVWKAIQAAAVAVWNWIQNAALNVFHVITAALRGFSGVVSGIWTAIKTAAAGAWDGIKDAAKTALDLILAPINAVKDALGHVSDAISNVIQWFGKIKIPDALKKAGDLIGRIPGIGSLSAPSTAGVAPMMSRAASSTRASSAGGVTINVSVPESSDPVATARYIKALIRRGEAAGVIFGAT